MGKLDETRANLVFDEEKVNDGINMAQWKEWDGEIVTLQREDTRWVYKQLKKLWALEEALNKVNHLMKRLEKSPGE